MTPKYLTRYQQQCNLIYAVAHRTARFFVPSVGSSAFLDA